MGQQLLLHLVKQLGAQACLRQAVAKQPYRLCVGNCTAVGQAQIRQEATAVEQLIFERVVSEIVELLQHQNLDHQNCRIRWPAALGPRRTWHSGINTSGQRSEVHMFGKASQGITQFLSTVPALFFGKQTGFGHHH